MGTEHILLGLLRVSNSPAALLLIDMGLTLEDVRQEVVNLLDESPKEHVSDRES